MDSYATALCERRPELTAETARTRLQDPLWYSAMMLVAGDTD